MVRAALPAKGGINYSQFGLEGYVMQHMAQYEDAMTLENEANEFMGGFRVYEQQSLRQLKRDKHTVDEDGWKKVVGKIKGAHSATNQFKQGNSFDEYKKRQEDEGKKVAKKSTDDFSVFAKTKKNLNKLIKVKKTLLKANSRRTSSKTVSLRNFADNC
eukprot:TRINITY_DN1522_c0_g1_i1.p2 TRINITY_DN1522_c0_g1~~TRINITY_DN1522_c0_g1_i1.p2  ORF type:complete len:158 (+),score=76.17 TRINITY_DN1522_c0_g1_i1:109-582(+)